MAKLSTRERQIVRLLNQGLAIKEIARHLQTRPATVRVQLHQARRKTDSKTTVELAVKVATGETE